MHVVKASKFQTAEKKYDLYFDKGLSFSFQSGVGLGGWYRNEWVFYFYFGLKKADRGTDVM